MTTTIILITCAFFFLLCIVLVIHRRIKNREGFRVKIGEDILFSFLGGIFFPVIIYMGFQKLYYHNRPRPLSRKLRKWLKKDLVIYKGKAMTLAQYNATYNKNYTLKQVYGRKYVKSLTPEDIAESDSNEIILNVNNDWDIMFPNRIKLTIEDDLPDDEITWIATKMAQAIYTGEMSIIYPNLYVDVQMISYKSSTVKGRKAFVDFWNDKLQRIKDLHRSLDIKVKMNSFYDHAVVSIDDRGFDNELVFFHVVSGKIKSVVITSEYLQPREIRYYSQNTPRLDYEEIMLKKKDSIKAEPNRMPCLLCGRLSEDLDWYKMTINSGPYSHSGQISVCPDCHTQAEFYPNKLTRNNKTPNFYSERFLPNGGRDNPYTMVFIKFQHSLNIAVKIAEANSGSIDKCDLFKLLGACEIDDNYHLGFTLPDKRTDGVVSKLYTYRGEGKSNNVFDHTCFERSEMGAWNAYLLDNAHMMIPVMWHDGADARQYIMTPDDLKSLFNGPRIRVSTKRLEMIPPTVKPGITDDTYIVECCYWNHYEGLIREKMKVQFTGNRVLEVSYIGSEVWFEYHEGSIPY